MGEETRRSESEDGRNIGKQLVSMSPDLWYNSKENNSDSMSKQQDIKLATAAQAGDKAARLELL